MFDNRDEVEDQNFWISYADLATGFMIVFLVITFILQDRQREKDELHGVYSEMISEFKDEIQAPGSVEVDEKNGTVRFLAGNSTEVEKLLFKIGGEELEKYFENLLDGFFPVFTEQIIKIQSNPNLLIKEIRVEGHTDDTPFGKSKNDPYLDNLSLSNQRALKVYEYFLQSSHFNNLDSLQKEFIRQNMISCGYSYAKGLDTQGKLLSANSTYDRDKSRRVEFRIIIEHKSLIDEN